MGLAFSFDARRPPGARSVASDAALARCTAEDKCLNEAPRIVVGGSGVSGGAFIDNAAFRTWAFETFGARVLDMESAAVAHVAYANDVPFIAIRSLSDLAGGSEGANQMEVFLDLAAGKRGICRQGAAQGDAGRALNRTAQSGARPFPQVKNGMSTMTARVATATPITSAAP